MTSLAAPPNPEPKGMVFQCAAMRFPRYNGGLQLCRFWDASSSGRVKAVLTVGASQTDFTLYTRSPMSPGPEVLVSGVILASKRRGLNHRKRQTQ